MTAINVPTATRRVKASPSVVGAGSTVAGLGSPVHFLRQHLTCFLDTWRTTDDEAKALRADAPRFPLLPSALANGAQNVNLVACCSRQPVWKPGGACMDASVQVYRCSLRLLRPTARRRPDGGTRFIFVSTQPEKRRRS